MKKVILSLSVIGLMTACGSSNETENPVTDSAAVVAVDTTIVADSVKTDSVKTDTTKVVTVTPTPTK